MKRTNNKVKQRDLITASHRVAADKEKIQERIKRREPFASIAETYGIPASTLATLCEINSIVRRPYNRKLVPTSLELPPAPNGSLLASMLHDIRRAIHDLALNVQAQNVVMRRTSIDLSIPSDELLPFLPPVVQRTLPFPPK